MHTARGGASSWMHLFFDVQLNIIRYTITIDRLSTGNAKHFHRRAVILLVPVSLSTDCIVYYVTSILRDSVVILLYDDNIIPIIIVTLMINDMIFCKTREHSENDCNTMHFLISTIRKLTAHRPFDGIIVIDFRKKRFKRVVKVSIVKLCRFQNNI